MPYFRVAPLTRLECKALLFLKSCATNTFGVRSSDAAVIGPRIHQLSAPTKSLRVISFPHPLCFGAIRICQHSVCLVRNAAAEASK